MVLICTIELDEEFLVVKVRDMRSLNDNNFMPTYNTLQMMLSLGTGYQALPRVG